MEKDRVIFAFDFVDPGSYLVWSLLRRWMKGDPDAAIRMLPLELTPPPQPVRSVADPRWREMTLALGEIARAEGIAFSPPDLLFRTRKAHEMALHAREKGRSVYDLLFRARFEEGLDLGRIDVLVELGEREGLEGPEIRTVLGVDRHGPAVEESRGEALGMGIRGVPTLLHGTERLEGFRSTAELRTLLEHAGLT
jgi:predicted DsbA family dithiol-disulfide isomerase